MSHSAGPNSYFTKHLFRTALGCPTKLYYKVRNYPESQVPLPFIAHNNLNKSQFKALVRCLHPQGHFVEESSVEEAFEKVSEYLLKEEVTLFDAPFIWQDSLVKFPIIQKKGTSVNVYYIQTKAFHPFKHRLTNHHGQIYPKWKDYLTDFAYQLFVIRQLYPRWELSPFLVLPNKVETTSIDQLYEQVQKTDGKAEEFEQTDADWEELLVQIDVSNLIESIWSGAAFDGTAFEGQSFGEAVHRMKKIYFSGEKYPVSVGSKCKNCEFRISRDQLMEGGKSGFNECWKQEIGSINRVTADEMVFDLIGPGTDQWIERELYFQQEVPPDEITTVREIQNKQGRITERQRQALQILKAKGLYVPDEIIKPQLFEELERWEYPIHFMDFEAGNYTVPIKSNRKPYHLVVFQYSCHSLQEDGSWSHYEWIDDLGNGYPNYECIRQLRKIPDLEKGTVVQYSNFERNALKTIRKELLQDEDAVADARDLVDWIELFITRHDSNVNQGPYLADLSRLVRNFYYNSQMSNSLSIKDVVQSVLTESAYLKQIYSEPYTSSNFNSVVWWQPAEQQEMVRSPYSILADQQEGSQVKRGTEAMVVYGKLLSNSIEEKDKAGHLSALLKYCELDTLAMLMIFQHWYSLMQAEPVDQ